MTRKEKLEQQRKTDALLQTIGPIFEERISNPRPSTYYAYRRAVDAWRAAHPLDHYCPVKPPLDLHGDRNGCLVYGIFWKGRMLRVDKTVWTNKSTALSRLHNHVARLLSYMLAAGGVFSEELTDVLKINTYETARQVVKWLKDQGYLEIRELDCIPNPIEQA